MSKALKIVFGLIGAVILLVVVAAIAVPLFVNPNDYKTQVAEMVKEQTGRELRIPGDIKLSVFPWLGADLGVVELGNAPGFDEPLFARTEQITVRVKLMPLLDKKVEMDTVTVRGLQLNLARDKNGRTNWDDLTQTKNGNAAPKEETSGQPPAVAALAIGGVRVENAAIRWHDAQAGQKVALDKLTVTTGALTLGQPIDLNIEFDVRSETPALTGHIKTSAKIDANPETQVIKASGLTLDAGLNSALLPGGRADLSLAGNVTLDGGKQSVNIAGLKLTAKELDLGAVKGDINVAGAIAGDLGAMRFDATGLRVDGALSGAAVKKLVFALTTNAGIDLGKQKLTVPALRVDVAEIDAAGLKGTATVLGVVDGDLAKQRFSVSKLAASGNLAGTDGGLRKVRFDLSGGVSADMAAQRVVLKDLRIKMPELALADLAGQANATVNITGDLNKMRFSLASLSADGQLSGEKGPVKSIRFKLDTAGSANLTAQTLNLTRLKLNVPAVALEQGNGSATVQATVKGNLAKSVFRVSKLVAETKLTGKTLPGGRVDARATGNVVANLSKQTLDVTDLRATALGLNTSGRVAVTNLNTTPQFTGSIKVARFSPRALLKRLGQPPIKTQDPKVLGRAEIATELSGTTDSLALNPLTVRLDDTQLKGKLSLAQFSAPLPSVRFDLNVDSLDADRYMPPSTPAKKKATATPGSAAAAAAGLPVDTLKSLDIQGKARVGRLKVSNLRVTDIHLQIGAKDGLIRVHPLGASIYKGKYQGDVNIDARGPQPVLSVDEKLTGVAAGPLLKDLSDLSVLTGQTDAVLKLQASGADTDAIKRTLSGNANFQFLDGEIKGVDIACWICGLSDMVGGLSSGDLKSALFGFVAGQVQQSASKPEGGGNSTRFTELNGRVNVINGTARNDDLEVISPLIEITGAGEANLVTERINYLVTPRLVSSCKGQGRSAVGSGLEVPVKISGTFQKPKYEPDLSGIKMAASRSSQPAPQQKQQAAPQPQPAQPQSPQEAIKQKTEEAVKGLFRGIFK